MTAANNGDLQLGADAVGSGDQDRIAKPRLLEVEQSSKPPMSSTTPARLVDRASGLMASTSVSPASMSTPASL